MEISNKICLHIHISNSPKINQNISFLNDYNILITKGILFKSGIIYTISSSCVFGNKDFFVRSPSRVKYETVSMNWIIELVKVTVKIRIKIHINGAKKNIMQPVGKFYRRPS